MRKNLDGNVSKNFLCARRDYQLCSEEKEVIHLVLEYICFGFSMALWADSLWHISIITKIYGFRRKLKLLLWIILCVLLDGF